MPFFHEQRRVEPGPCVDNRSILKPRRQFLDFLIESTRTENQIDNVIAQGYFSVFVAALLPRVNEVSVSVRAERTLLSPVGADLRITCHVGPHTANLKDVWLSSNGRDGFQGGIE